MSDSPYPKEAFSIGEERDGENAVEGPVEVEDMDECLIYEGNICHHRCVNTPGSYRCECLPGYVLQDDAFTCAQGKVKTTNHITQCQQTFSVMLVHSKATLCAICSLKYDLQSAFLSRRAHLLSFVYAFTVYYFPGVFEFLPVCKP